MSRLTNKQLDILVGAVLDRIDDLKATTRESDEYQETVAALIKEHPAVADLDEYQELADAYNEVNQRRDRLNTQMNTKRRQIRSEHGFSQYTLADWRAEITQRAQRIADEQMGLPSVSQRRIEQLLVTTKFEELDELADKVIEKVTS